MQKPDLFLILRISLVVSCRTSFSTPLAIALRQPRFLDNQLSDVFEYYQLSLNAVEDDKNLPGAINTCAFLERDTEENSVGAICWLSKKTESIHLTDDNDADKAHASIFCFVTFFQLPIKPL